MKKQYTTEFKKQAIDLADSLNSISRAARELGIRDSNIHAWRKKLGKSKPNADSINQSDAEELKRLRREVAEQKQVIHILKRAAAFFSQDHLK